MRLIPNLNQAVNRFVEGLVSVGKYLIGFVFGPLKVRIGWVVNALNLHAALVVCGARERFSHRGISVALLGLLNRLIQLKGRQLSAHCCKLVGLKVRLVMFVGVGCPQLRKLQVMGRLN